MAALPDTVHLGGDSIDLLLKADGTAVDPSSVTETARAVGSGVIPNSNLNGIVWRSLSLVIHEQTDLPSPGASPSP
jgi:hypothetical protein